MSGETVVVQGDDEGEASASFEAGVAAATSVQAQQEAQEAGQTAEVAAGTAQEARQTAEVAVSQAYDAQAGVEGLRGELGSFMDEMRTALTALATREPEPEAEAVPAPEPEPAAEPAAEPEEKKPRKRRYGSSRIFGDHAYEDD